MKVSKYNNYWASFEFNSDAERAMVEKATSYEIPGAQFSAAFTNNLWDGTKRFLTTGNKLPMGLFKSLFPEHLLCYDSTITLDFTDIPLFVDNPSYDRRQYQLDAINTILRHKRGIVAAVVGAGKTLISAATISYHLENVTNGKVLFVCYDKNILEQTIKNFKAYGLHATSFGGGVKDLTGDVIVATIQSLSRIEQPAKVLKGITMCFCDESHHSKSKTSKDVLTKLKNCEYYIGLTATPPKPNTLEMAELMCVIGPIIFEYGFVTATEAGNIAPVKCFFLKTPFSYATKGAVVNRRNYKWIWDGGIKDSEVRNKAIANICQALVNLLDTPILINTDRVEHGHKIQEAIDALENSIGCVEMYGEDSVAMRDIKRIALSIINEQK